MALAGWIKLHRALADHHVASDPSSLAVWVHLLMQANHAETKRQINGQVVIIKAGQLITSRKSLSEKTGVQESKVERVLKMLQNEQQIEQHGTAKFRVISIVNWDSYQSGEQASEQQMNSKRTAYEQQMNTPGEVLELEECKERALPPKSPKGDVDKMFEQFWKLYPNKTGKKKAQEKWGKLKVDQSLFNTIMTGLGRQSVSQAWTKDGGQFVPHATTWLNGERWNDEVKPQQAAISRHHGFDQIDYSKGLKEENADGSFNF